MEVSKRLFLQKKTLLLPHVLVCNTCICSWSDAVLVPETRSYEPQTCRGSWFPKKASWNYTEGAEEYQVRKVLVIEVHGTRGVSLQVSDPWFETILSQRCPTHQGAHTVKSKGNRTCGHPRRGLYRFLLLSSYWSDTDSIQVRNYIVLRITNAKRFWRKVFGALFNYDFLKKEIH